MGSLLLETVGKAFRETGQALERVGQRLVHVEDLRQVPFSKNLSRHRTLMPTFTGGKPRVGKDVFIAPSVSVVGNVKIGNHANLWYVGERAKRRSFTCEERSDEATIKVVA